MTLILYLVKDGKTPLYIACYRGHDKVVQVLLEHGVEMDVPDEVSDISCTHVKLCNTTKVNEATLWHRKLTKVVFMSYYNLNLNDNSNAEFCYNS